MVINEKMVIILLALLLSVLTSLHWDVELLERVRIILAALYTPGVWLVVSLVGGAGSASAIHIALGVVMQTLLVYWFVKSLQ